MNALSTTSGSISMDILYTWDLFTSSLISLFVLLFCAIATVFQFYLGGDMMYEMRRGKPNPILLLTQGIVNVPHYIGMV